MPKKPIHKGQFSSFAALCCAPGNEENPNFGMYQDVFDAFYGTEGDDSSTVEAALNADLSQWEIPDSFILWAMCRAHVIDSFVLRQFASDCLEHAAPAILAASLGLDADLLPLSGHGTMSNFIANVVDCARSYAVADCDTVMLTDTREEVTTLLEASTGLAPHMKHFINVCQYVLGPHPDGGAVQCAMNIPRCLLEIGLSDTDESGWQLEALKTRCRDAGFFDE